MVFAMVLQVWPVHAQKETSPDIKTNEWGIPRVYFPETNTSTKMTSDEFFEKILKVRDNDIFILRNSSKRKEERHHDLFEQYYQGIKVAGCDYVIHYKEGYVSYAHGDYVPIENVDVHPSITKEMAIYILAEHEKMRYASTDEFKVSLVIVPPKILENNIKEGAKLAYDITLPFVGKVGFVDAHTGEVLLVASTISCSSATGTLYTYYSGGKQVPTQFYNNQYHLVDSMTNAVIHTWNLNGDNSFSSITELSDDDNIWTLNLNQTDRLYLAHDVYWGVHATYDYIYNHHNRNSFDDEGCDINSYINYNERDNACWNRSERSLKFAKYNQYYNPLVSLDIVAHEYGHGITADKIGWDDPQYWITIPFENTLEIMACNEGLSDIWGAIIEAGVKGTSCMWKIAEECMLPNSQSCLRNIAYPTDPNADSVIADTYKSSTYNSCEKHGKGGVFSRWFYLLVNGGSGTNGVGNKYNVIGVGLSAAEQFIVDAIYEDALYHTKSFQEVRTALKNYAINCSNSFLAQQIENAWYAVGVGNKPSQMSISGSSTLCTSEVYSLSNLPFYYSVLWSLTSGNTSSVTLSANTPSVNQCTLTVNNVNTFNSVTLTAQIKLSGTVVGTINKQITKSQPFSGTYEETSGSYNGNPTPAISQTAITNPSATYVYIGGIVTLTSEYFRGKNITTSGPYGNFQHIGNNIVNFSLCPWNVNQSFTIIVQEQGCDDEVQLTFYAYPTQNYNLNIIPQGSQTYELSVTRNEVTERRQENVFDTEERSQEYASAEKVGSRLIDEPWSLEVTNAVNGRNALSRKMDDPVFILNTAGWEPGVYIVRAIVGKESLTGKIIVN
jgi:Zn-dependent metalloprotease